MTPQEKILCVLNKIKDHIELASSKKIEREQGIKITTQYFLGDCSLNFYELRDVLENLEEKGFLKRFEHISEVLDNYILVFPTQRFDDLFNDFKKIVLRNSKSKNGLDISILIGLLEQQIEKSKHYFDNPFDKAAQSWASKSKQLIAKVDHGMSQEFSKLMSKYERLKSKPVSKKGETEVLRNSIMKKVLEAKDYLFLSDEGLTEIRLEKAYEAGDPFAFIGDILSLIKKANQEILMIDPYMDDETFSFFLSNLKSESVNVKLLIKPKKNKISKKVLDSFRKSNPGINLEIRNSKEIHDRVLFIDDRCWVIGQSIKDAATQKPTYMVEVEQQKKLRKIYDDIWQKSEKRK